MWTAPIAAASPVPDSAWGRRSIADTSRGIVVLGAVAGAHGVVAPGALLIRSGTVLEPRLAVDVGTDIQAHPANA